MEIRKYKKEDFAVIKERFTALGISEATFSKEVSFAIQIIGKTPLIAQCNPESVLQSVMNLAQVGLTLNPVAKEAYLIPRYDRASKGYVCYLEPDYRGLVRLATDTGSVIKITTNLVYAGDEFELKYGLETDIAHRPYFTLGKEKGEITGCYSVAKLHDGSYQVEYMSIDELDMIKARSESFKAFADGKISTCIWNTDSGEMYRKTVIKRLFKYLPRTTQNDQLNHAVELDNQDFRATTGQISFIESLLTNCSLSPESIIEIERMLPSMLSHQAEATILHLQNNQLDKIMSGKGYGQKEIHERLKKIEQDEKA